MSGSIQSPGLIPDNVTQIVLTGFMGAGKTTAGLLAAARLQWRFVDTDRIVEERAGMTVAQVFEQQGEAAFREMEAAAVREAAGAEHMVVALGGGALERGETRAFLASLEHCRVVYLEAPFDMLMERCGGQAGGVVRPVLRDQERLAARWSARLPLYRLAHATVPTAGLSPEQVADAVLAAVREAECAASERGGKS